MEQNTDAEVWFATAVVALERPQPMLVLRSCFRLFSEIGVK